jgi:hypothetical protein
MIPTAMDTVPETVAPFAGDVILTLPVGAGVGVGLGPFFTRTSLEEVPSNWLVESYAFAEMVWMPLAAPVDIHSMALGVDAR